MMRTFIKILSKFALLLALLTVSCHDDFAERHAGDSHPTIPFDFNWKMTQDLSVTVDAPIVAGSKFNYAIIRIYSSPTLTEDNRLAEGMVTPQKNTFSTAFTLPSVSEDICVQTILPDGTTSSQVIPITATQLHVSGAVMKSMATQAPVVRTSTSRAKKQSSMPTDYPTFKEPNAADFDEVATIATTPDAVRDLAGGWSGSTNYPARAAYYIPAGAHIDGNLTLQGSNQHPILYVAGTFNASSLHVGQASLVVLPGGRVEITGSLTAQNSGETGKAAIYTFDGGTLTTGIANLSCKCVVNQGVFNINRLLDINGSCDFYNTASGEIVTENFVFSNSGLLANDGKFTVYETMSANGSHQMTHYENSTFTTDGCVLESGVTLTLKGQCTMHELDLRGSLYVNCSALIEELDAENGKIYISSGACLETYDAEFNNSQLSLAAQSLFIAKEFEGPRGNKIINKEKDNDNTLKAVVMFKQAEARGTDFQGPIEVVYDYSNLDSDYRLSTKKFKKGATLVPVQTVNIQASECNGGKGSITPKPEPEPEYYDKKGALYTYCFEDNWPWFGDYDMNDLVVAVSVDARIKIATDEVESITIHWEPKATGATRKIACAIQLDKIPTDLVASVSTTHTMGAGPFVTEGGLERDNAQAVVPLFNSVREVFPSTSVYINTSRDMPKVQTTRHTTTITFNRPVRTTEVLESTMNLFLVINPMEVEEFSRTMEIHMAYYEPTKHAIVNIYNTVLADSPYKYYAMGGNLSDNGMMWGLMIPGNFRYPAEMQDIRKTYLSFMKWAGGGAAEDKEWYNGEVNAELLYE
ncbi:MAG: LruC domain-containing protein [Alistipes sp.]